MSAKSEGIGWKSGSDFDCGLCCLSSVQRRERLVKLRLMEKYLFSLLDEMSEDVFLVSHMDFKWEDWSPWFTDFVNRGRLKKNIFYREIINEANKRGIKLMTTRVIDYKENRTLAEKFFRGNAEYISNVCFCIPEHNFAVIPSHTMEFVLYCNDKNEYYRDFVKKLLSCLGELKPAW
ncbi:MAG: hypothetical protein LUD81_05150 [Clostridiales bacterium]|nr:hypothetical protein [Clostridiales bacterium]